MGYIPPPPLRFGEKSRRGNEGGVRFGRDDGELTFLRALKASGLASLFRRNLSSGVRLLGSLLIRKLSMTESSVVLREQTNRSGDLREAPPI